MSDLSHETRKLIAMAREGDPIPPGRRALIESKLFTRVAGGALIGLAAREAWAHSAGLFSTLAKGVAGLAVLSSLGAGGYLAVRAARNETSPVHSTFVASRPTPRPAEPLQPMAEALVAPTNEMAPPTNPIAPAHPTVAPPSRDVASRHATPTLVAKVSGSSSRGAGARAQTSARVAAATTAQAAQPAQAQAAPPPEQAAPQPPEEATPARPPSTLADETRLLWEADQALRSGKTSRAVSLLDEHMSRYPEGALGPERGAERVVALCKLGRIDAATVRAYLASHPNLPLSDRIQQTCAPILSRGQ